MRQAHRRTEPAVIALGDVVALFAFGLVLFAVWVLIASGS